VQLEQASGGKVVGRYRKMPAARPAPEALGEYAGTFYSEELDVDWKVAAVDGKLVVQRRRFPNATLTPLWPDAFRANSLLFRFSRGADGRVSGVVVGAGRVRQLRFVRQRE
jgi:hypothetical protein